MADAWTWIARYDDGACVAELDPHGDHGFADVDLERVRAFELQPSNPDSSLPSFCVLIDPARGQRPIFFRRRATAWLLAGGESETVLTCVGRRDDASATYLFLDAQGHVVVSADDIGVGS